VIMLAEKAADLLRGNSPLAPDTAAFYRHDRDAVVSQSPPSAAR
jgi:hypothetical protein